MAVVWEMKPLQDRLGTGIGSPGPCGGAKESGLVSLEPRIHLQMGPSMNNEPTRARTFTAALTT